ncbi:MAG: DUF3267 domain-containing protein [Ruminococcaceae bacterium]|nr:DUF3267 domain-containing protein [Oscillospiraceae bacterium]
MKIHFKGIYKGKSEQLDYLDKYCETEHKPGAIKLPKQKKFYYLKVHLFYTLIFVLFSFILCLRYHLVTNSSDRLFFVLILGFFTILHTLLLPIHEILHTVFNKKDSFIYIYPKGLCMFVMNIEEKSKAIKILEFLFPSIILGLLPFVIGLIFPQFKFLGIFAIPGIATGAGDYMNIFRFLRYIPNGAKIYTHIDDGEFWYIPEESELN